MTASSLAHAASPFTSPPAPPQRASASRSGSQINEGRLSRASTGLGIASASKATANKTSKGSTVRSRTQTLMTMPGLSSQVSGHDNTGKLHFDRSSTKHQITRWMKDLGSRVAMGSTPTQSVGSLGDELTSEPENDWASADPIAKHMPKAKRITSNSSSRKGCGCRNKDGTPKSTFLCTIHNSQLVISGAGPVIGQKGVAPRSLGGHPLRQSVSAQHAAVTSPKSPNPSHIMGIESDDEDDADTAVDEVIVEACWADWAGADGGKSDAGSVHNGLPGTGMSHYSRRGSHRGSAFPEEEEIVSDSARSDYSMRTHHRVWYVLRHRMYPAVHHFFDQSFADPEREAQFQKEIWWNGKLMCLIGALYFLLNFVLYAAEAPKPALYDKILFFGVAPVLCFILTAMVLWDWPRTHNYSWQVWVFLSVWFWPVATISIEYSCNFFGPGPNTCGDHTFTTGGLYATGYPILALMVMRASRLSMFLGTSVIIGLISGFIIAVDKSYTRTMVDFIIFIWIFIVISFVRERADRGLSTLRNQLRVQYKATQAAQIAERKAHSARKRFSNYIFHEVRVPLNNAMLALQTLDSDGVFKKTANTDHEIEYTALNGSLVMMSKVLNDVLDFNRMEAGRLEKVSTPFNIHESIISNLGVLKVAASMKNVDLEVQLDDRIDQVAKVAANAKLLHSDEEKDAERPEMPGLVVGDEMRFKQVMNNIAANAVKFTSNGGRIKFITKLVYPQIDAVEALLYPTKDAARSTTPVSQGITNPSTTSGTAVDDASTSPVNTTVEKDIEKGLIHPDQPTITRVMTEQSVVPEKHADKRPKFIVVRMEVHDTGPGLRLNDVAGGKLFSPYVQTTIGKLQGGKGTGLGLALVRQIVQLSEGRLGVQSHIGKGSCFWVEFPLEIGWESIEMHRKKDVKPTRTFATLQNHTPKLMKGDGGFAPLQPVPNMKIKFSHTDSALSQHPHEQNLFTPEHERWKYESAGIHSSAGSNASWQWEPPSATSLSSNLTAHLQTLHPIISNRDGEQTASQPVTSSIPNPAYVPRPPLSRTSSGRLFTPAQMGRTDSNGEHPIHDVPTDHHVTTDMPEGTQVDASFMSCIHDTSQLSKKLQESSRPTCNQKSHSLPRGDSDNSASPVSPLSPSDWPLHVLVVDDDPLTRTLMSRTVTRILKNDGGVDLQTAEHGGAAVQYLLGSVPAGTPHLEYAEPPTNRAGEAHYPDLILLDHQMPVMTGLQVARELRKAGRKDFIIGVTANAAQEDQEEFVISGADRVLIKPVNAISLRNVLQEARQRRNAT